MAGVLPGTITALAVTSRQYNTAAALNACGNTETSVGSGTATANVGTNGNYWSSTANPANDSNAFNWNFNSGNLNENQNAKEYGFSVRLFATRNLYTPEGAFLLE